MRIGLQDVTSATVLSDISNSTFVFVGEDYPFAAAKSFSVYASKILGLPVTFHNAPSSVLEEGFVHLFGTQGEDASEFILRQGYNSCRIIPMKEGVFASKGTWGKFVSKCFVVEVPTPTEKTLEGDFQFICSLMEVPSKPEVLKEAIKKCGLSTSSILHTAEFSMAFGGLTDKDNIPPEVSSERLDYQKFREIFLFKNSLEISLAIAKVEDPMETTSRLLNDLAVYAAIVAEDAAGVSAKVIATSYGQNEFFMKNKLLPRLKALGMPRILSLMNKVSEMQSLVLNGGAVDPTAQMSATFLMAFS
jgi:hypothetical protein